MFQLYILIYQHLMNKAKEPPVETVRDKKAKQLKMTALKQEAKDTKTKQIYEQCLQEIKAQGKGNYFLKHQDESNSERESIKHIRNIFKMSRVLVNTNLKESKKKMRKSDLDK